MTKPIAPCLWFNGNALEAATYYCSVFDDAEIVRIERYGDTGPDPKAPVVFIEFKLNGQTFQAINDPGTAFPFTEAISFSIECADQVELDRYWNALVDGGSPIQCGWLKDRYGLPWQIVPTRLNELLNDPDRARAGRAWQKMLQMVKLDIAELEAAADAEAALAG